MKEKWEKRRRLEKKEIGGEVMEWRRTRKSGMEGIIELGETEF